MHTWVVQATHFVLERELTSPANERESAAKRDFVLRVEQSCTTRLIASTNVYLFPHKLLRDLVVASQTGPVPSWLGGLRVLKILKLRTNQLSGK